MAKIIDAIRMAHLKGYRVTSEGEVINAAGRVRKLVIKGKGSEARFTFTVGMPNRKSQTLHVHRLAAFQQFGEDALVEGIHTRHLDGNGFNNCPNNIAIGSRSDNARDREPKARRIHAAQSGQNFTEEFIVQIRKEHGPDMSYKKLSKKYGIPKSTLSYYLSKTAKNHSYLFPLNGREHEDFKPSA